MSREIKFRAKRLNNNEFVIGYYLPMVYGYKHFIYLPLEYLNEHSRIEIDPKTLGQYTGLKDKDGKEIYEGYIVGGTLEDGTNGRSPVFWCYNCYQPFSYLNCRSEDLEILGNIYENPELLNKDGE